MVELGCLLAHSKIGGGWREEASDEAPGYCKVHSSHNAFIEIQLTSHEAYHLGQTSQWF